jgi:hypothetical protein
LHYWNNSWIPAEIKKADYNFIEFENIPSKTLYWLRNLDHGKEEQPFFYRNGKQVFSNQADSLFYQVNFSFGKRALLFY